MNSQPGGCENSYIFFLSLCLIYSLYKADGALYKPYILMYEDMFLDQINFYLNDGSNLNNGGNGEFTGVSSFL
jgi:hypothetical protein